MVQTLAQADLIWLPGGSQSRLLRELNSWSRDHDWPMSTNSWIAEEAVRRSW